MEYGGYAMNVITIQLHHVNQVREFVNLASTYPFDIDLVSGRYTVDAKSLLGIYSLDLNNPLQVIIYGDYAEDFAKKLEAYRAQ